MTENKTDEEIKRALDIEVEKPRKIIISITKNSISLDKESEHASVFELIAVLNTVIQMNNKTQPTQDVNN